MRGGMAHPPGHTVRRDDGTNGRRRPTLCPNHAERARIMRTTGPTGRSAFAVCVVTLLLAALTFGATGRASSDTTQGVTKDSVKVGIALIDFTAIKDFVDYTFGDTKAIAQTFVD